MKSMLRTVNDKGLIYDCLAFVCPGCAEKREEKFINSGLHILPVNTEIKSPSWSWDGNLERPTLNPSILTGKNTPYICHSFLRDGIFIFLEDSTHSLAGKQVPIPDLPTWVYEIED